ncbi:hypothetical protein VMT65_00255 [Nocardia sp. CDC153]|uniref:hypothetical protein n=1 Tax=Nocardia sp. CDC153 TaxID=3112167 RepID=UPI002DB7F24A|nr:hypothetical protein [Nocardia sp. CDC153]MEC3951452.1 hypothetical protein [Nocardia sp. CDC153]
MAIQDFDWLISSDKADEVAFRVDVPGEDRGRWVLSYLPTYRRLSRDEAIVGLRLAEMILIGLSSPAGEFDAEVATLHAEMIGVTVTDVMCWLALRAAGRDREVDRDEEAESIRSAS